MFSSYSRLCVFHCSHRLLCWINSRVREFSVKIALISYWNSSSQIPLGECSSQRRATKICKKFKFWKFSERPLFNISEYAFKPRSNSNSDRTLALPVQRYTTGHWLTLSWRNQTCHQYFCSQKMFKITWSRHSIAKTSVFAIEISNSKYHVILHLKI